MAHHSSAPHHSCFSRRGGRLLKAQAYSSLELVFADCKDWPTLSAEHRGPPPPSDMTPELWRKADEQASQAHALSQQRCGWLDAITRLGPPGRVLDGAIAGALGAIGTGRRLGRCPGRLLGRHVGALVTDSTSTHPHRRRPPRPSQCFPRAQGRRPRHFVSLIGQLPRDMRALCTRRACGRRGVLCVVQVAGNIIRRRNR